MKLILFDIDGTLVRISHDVTMAAFRDVFISAFDYTGDVPNLEFHGKTDRQIFLELCEVMGHEQGAVECRLDELGDSLMEAWGRYLNAETVRLLDGVCQTLERLEQRDDVLLGLLTGNLEQGAQLKLAPHNLNRFFSFGSYGSDAIERVKLPPIALERANALNGHCFTFDQTLIVGDSYRDIECAKAWGIHAFCVATGAMSADQLREHHPDAVAESLLDNDFIFSFLDATP